MCDCCCRLCPRVCWVACRDPGSVSITRPSSEQPADVFCDSVTDKIKTHFCFCSVICNLCYILKTVLNADTTHNTWQRCSHNLGVLGYNYNGSQSYTVRFTSTTCNLDLRCNLAVTRSTSTRMMDNWIPGQRWDSAALCWLPRHLRLQVVTHVTRVIR